MFGGYQSMEELVQNLTDAGCDKDTIAGVLSCLQSGNKAESLAQLEKQRSNLLSNIHNEQASIEYLDRLLYELKDQATSSEG